MGAGGVPQGEIVEVEHMMAAADGQVSSMFLDEHRSERGARRKKIDVLALDAVHVSV